MSGEGLHRTHRTALLDVHLGAITRGLGGGLRRILRGQPRPAAIMMAGPMVSVTGIYYCAVLRYSAE